jgi:hypothetical protein
LTQFALERNNFAHVELTSFGRFTKAVCADIGTVLLLSVLSHIVLPPLPGKAGWRGRAGPLLMQIRD